MRDWDRTGREVLGGGIFLLLAAMALFVAVSPILGFIMAVVAGCLIGVAGMYLDPPFPR